MGVQSEIAQVSVGNGSEEKSSLLHEKQIGELNQGLGINETIKFGSHGSDEPIEGEVNTVHDRKDAVDEWPAPKQVYYFYFVKYRSYEDQKVKAKVDQAEKELNKLNQNRFQITEKLRAQRSDRGQVIDQLRSISVETKQFRMIMDKKRKEMEPLQQALGKLRSTNNRGGEKGFGICSSEQELNDLIKSLQYRIQHESIPLTEEKKILRDIKQLEGTREKVIANAAMRAQIQDSLGEKEVIQDQVKLIGVDLDGVRKEQQVVKAKLKQLDDEKVAIEKKIDSLQEELGIVTEKRDKTFEEIRELRKQLEEGNTCYYQNRTLLNKARELATKKDIEGLKELSDTEVGKFMSVWSSTKSFRDDYEKRILPSLDARHLSRDGRMRNPDEKPLVPSPETEIVAKPNIKQAKEDPILPPQQNTSSVQKEKEKEKEKNAKNPKEANNKVPENTLKQSNSEDRDGISGLEELEKDLPPPPPPPTTTKRKEVDEAKLKEMKREEEIAKAKQALERKKKLTEKAAAKAAIKAQKEAEKKIKDREKKAKKKAAASVSAPDLEEPTEEAADVAEPEKVEENVEVSVPLKNKKQNENNIRYRRGRGKGPDSLSKVMLNKRKKSTNYWVWAVPAALLVLVLLAVGYYYLL